MTSENLRLLQAAFDAQRDDHNLTYQRVERDPVRGIPETGFKREVYGSKSTPFRYDGALPTGISELGRTEAWDQGPGEPFLNFEDPLDVAAMMEAAGEVFGDQVEIKQSGPYIKKSGRGDAAYRVNIGEHNLFVFWDMFSVSGESVGPRGRVNYYTDSGTEEESALVIQTIERYLELRGHSKFPVSREEFYELVDAKELTPEELRASRLPDSSLVSTWVRFRNGDREYTAVHVYENPNGPYILLSSNDKDEEDFRKVERGIAKAVKGRPEGHVTERMNDICDSIRLPEKPTQRKVAEYVERYSGQFRDVRITEAHFKDVPRAAFENPGFPTEKLDFN